MTATTRTPRRRPSALDDQPTTPTDRARRPAQHTPTPEDRARDLAERLDAHVRERALEREADALAEPFDDAEAEQLRRERNLLADDLAERERVLSPPTDKFVEGVYKRRALEDLDAHERRAESFLAPLAPEPPTTPRALELAADECCARIPGIEPDEIARIAAEIRSGFARAREAILKGERGESVRVIGSALGLSSKLEWAEWRESRSRAHSARQSARARRPRGPRNAERNAEIRAKAEEIRARCIECSTTELAELLSRVANREIKEAREKGEPLGAKHLANAIARRSVRTLRRILSQETRIGR